ncbi:MAG: glycoside hydrolase family 13 protein [bacterium]|nr:glycoside hydrolase family 13 protein [bacterium]
MMLHDSHDAFYRVPAGPVPTGQVILFRFRCDEASSVILRTWSGTEHAYSMIPSQADAHVWEVSIKAPSEPGLFWYDFIIYRRDNRVVRYGNADDQLGGVGVSREDGSSPASYQLTVYRRSYRTPTFMHGANIYQIFPDRFFKAPTQAVDPRTDRPMHKCWDEPVLYEKDSPDGTYQALDCYGGTINGIIEKLPYLKELGVTVIYLNPVFKSRSNHRYDTGDYTQVDPLLGTNEELGMLFSRAKEMNMHVMLDGVFSHTGADSLYFNQYGNYPGKGAYQGKESPYYSWYTFRHFPNDFKCWWNFVSLPECRKDNPDYQQFMFQDETGIVPRWIHAGSCGWRLDVADELSMDFLRKLRVAAKKADHDAVVLGEVWEDASNKIAYNELRCYCCGDTLDSVMNYPLREAILGFVSGKGTAHDLVRLVKHQAEVYPPQFRYALMNLVGSHDRARALNVLVGRDGQGMQRAEQAALTLSHAEYTLAVKRYKLCIDLLCALPGCPTVYYGDEAGMTGCTDPFCRKPYPWGREDRELQSYVKAKLTHHRHSVVLRLGHCEIEALDDDTVRIRRFLNGSDGLGHKAADGVQEIVTVNRK